MFSATARPVRLAGSRAEAEIDELLKAAEAAIEANVIRGRVDELLEQLGRKRRKATRKNEGVDSGCGDDSTRKVTEVSPSLEVSEQREGWLQMNP
jgi:hypothetical protein